MLIATCGRLGTVAEVPGIDPARDGSGDEQVVNAETVASIAGYYPLKSTTPLCSKEEWERIGPFVRETVSRLSYLAPLGVRSYLTAMTRLATWADREGLGLDRETLLSSPVVEFYVSTMNSSQKDYRSYLRRLGREWGIEVAPTTKSYARSEYQPPYTLQEITAFLTFAAAMSNQLRRERLSAVVLLGAGAGIVRGDLRGIDRDAVHEHDGVLHVSVAGRCVPIRPELQEAMADFVSWCSTDKPFFEGKPGANITNQIRGWVEERGGLAEFSTDRLRAYFVCAHLREGTGLLELMNLTGFAKPDSLGRYVDMCDRPKDGCDRTKAES